MHLAIHPMTGVGLNVQQLSTGIMGNPAMVLTTNIPTDPAISATQKTTRSLPRPIQCTLRPRPYATVKVSDQFITYSDCFIRLLLILSDKTKPLLVSDSL